MMSISLKNDLNQAHKVSPQSMVDRPQPPDFHEAKFTL